VTSALPFVLIVQQVAMRTSIDSVIVLGASIASAAVAAVAATFSSMVVRNRVLAWAAATMAVLFAAMVPPGTWAILTSIALSIAGAGLTARWADAHVRYFTDDDLAGREA
jgi:hypothetical protein